MEPSPNTSPPGLSRTSAAVSAADILDSVRQLPILPGGLVNIALSFSGGGFRAAAFCLGCFAYLDECPLGDQKLSARVRFISSSSGGSFASMSIVHAQRKKEHFRDAYQRLHNAINGDDLLKRVHKILKTDGIWEHERPGKERNLINAFAVAYDQMLFAGDTFDVLWNQSLPGAVNEICVNTTDFTHGQQFRFQHDGTPTYRGVFGNGYLNIREGEGTDDEREKFKERNWKLIRKIKLGDILAASSCFPVGFEPIIFPNDFSWATENEGLTSTELENALESDGRFINSSAGKHDRIGSFAFMDGGIVDNQGIDAFVLAENRLNSEQAKPMLAELRAEEKDRLKKPGLTSLEKEIIKGDYKAKRELTATTGFDLFAACDVSSNFTDEYTVSPGRTSWFLKPSLAMYLLLFVVVFLAGCYGVYSGGYAQAGYILIGFFALPVSLSLVAAAILGYRFVYRLFFKKRKQGDSVLSLFGKHIWYLINTPLNKLTGMFTARATSLVALSTTVFLKKIRQNAYSSHLRSGLSGNGVKTFIARAVADKILDVLRSGELNQLLSNLKSWKNQTINPTVHMLASKNSLNLDRDVKGDNWDAEKVFVETEDGQVLLFDVLKPEKAIRDVADLAAGMDTTLWFDKKNVNENMRAALIATGQFSMCHSLLRFSHRFGNTDPDWEKWKKQLLTDWVKFQKDPYWLYAKIQGELTGATKSSD